MPKNARVVRKLFSKVPFDSYLLGYHFCGLRPKRGKLRAEVQQSIINNQKLIGTEQT